MPKLHSSITIISQFDQSQHHVLHYLFRECNWKLPRQGKHPPFIRRVIEDTDIWFGLHGFWLSLQSIKEVLTGETRCFQEQSVTTGSVWSMWFYWYIQQQQKMSYPVIGDGGRRDERCHGQKQLKNKGGRRENKIQVKLFILSPSVSISRS